MRSKRRRSTHSTMLLLKLVPILGFISTRMDGTITLELRVQKFAYGDLVH